MIERQALLDRAAWYHAEADACERIGAHRLAAVWRRWAADVAKDAG